MGDTLMRNSAKVALNDHQQIEKYSGLNCYSLYLSDTDRVGYVAGDAANGLHNSFKLTIPANGSSHIKNALVRMKFLGMPITPDGAANYGFGYVKTNFVKNCYSSKIGFNNQILGAFGVKEVVLVDETEVPALSTTGGRLTQTAADLPALVACNNINQIGAIYDGAGERTISVGSAAAIPNITQAGYTINSKSLVAAKVGTPLSDNWILCDNPFGKTLSFDIVGEDMTTLLDLGHVF
jgi:hypothetical protein